MRIANLDDVDKVWRVFNELNVGEINVFNRSVTLSLIRSMRVLVVEKWGVIAGAMALKLRDPLEVFAIAVHPDFKKQGIGSQLLKEADKEAQRFGATSIFAESYAIYGVRGFYEKNGYNTTVLGNGYNFRKEV